MAKPHKETHKIHTIGWLRAAVLGANDGIVSTASLVLGVAASGADHANILVAGIAGLAAGAMAMAAGEYVSVSSQEDTEKAALNKERRELEEDYTSEHAELAAIYVRRGLDLTLANEVAEKLMTHDALGAHTLDELGISEVTSAKPLQAAIASACSFAIGASLPLGIVLLAPAKNLIPIIAVGALLLLALLGGLAAKAGGARIFPAVVRVTFWSALALGVTFGVGALFGAKTG
jgi:VIT1/CCC1 family predicted Fe2+/Mn2+ transporter